MYESWKILLDTASTQPGLGFDDAAEALGDLVLTSPPRFAIGIFGVWGSGKTTLMQAILGQVKATPEAVPVWFNAWRYEREEHLIVPMLDTLRDGLVQWSDECAGSKVVEGKARKAASTVAKAARALLSGFTLKARLLGVDASLDANKVVAEWRKSGEAEDEAEAQSPQSFYHASFRALEGAIGEFVEDGRRIVVFVDDLDRCLPEHALQVLESMKLFFDLPGFVFVVGLDQGVIERAVALKYTAGDGGPETAVPGIAGTDYVKKIFQVQFTVPRVVEDQLDDFVGLVAKELPGPQGTNIATAVRPHLRYLATNGSVNPREVKRFVNDYTVQLKMLEKKLGSKVPAEDPDPGAVLALLTMSFHPEWRSLYDQLVVEPGEFREACREMLDESRSASTLQLGPTQVPVPTDFVRYVRAEGRALAYVPLEVYVSSVEATGSTDTAVVEAKRALRRVRRIIAAEEQQDLPAAVGRLAETLRMAARESGGEDLLKRLDQLGEVPLGTEAAPDALRNWTDEATAVLADVDTFLRDLRRRASGSPTAS